MRFTHFTDEDAEAQRGRNSPSVIHRPQSMSSSGENQNLGLPSLENNSSMNISSGCHVFVECYYVSDPSHTIVL